MKFIIGNWKSNGSIKEVNDWCQEIKQQLPQLSQKFTDRHFCLCAPYVFLPAFAENLARLLQDEEINCSLGSQDISAFAGGNYTGEINFAMLQEFTSDYAIIGHSERRALLKEDNPLLEAKLVIALQNKITPIFCVGESAAEYEAGKTQEVIKAQLQPVITAIESGTYQDIAIVLAYEPVWAIGTGKAAEPELANDVHSFICDFLAQSIQSSAANIYEPYVLYGGSVKPDNAADFLAEPKIDGLLVGGASLDASSFLQIFSAGP